MPQYDFKCIKGHAFVHECKMAQVDDPVACPVDACGELAENMCNFGGLDHGIGLFSDLAKEGRFDEDNLPTSYMSSGRGAWRKR